MYIQWSPVFEIGVPRIDAEHRHLTGIVNAFYEVCRADRGRSRTDFVVFGYGPQPLHKAL